MKKRTVAPALGIALALLVAGCGSDSDDPVTAPPPPSPPTPAPPAPPPMPPTASKSCSAFPTASGPVAGNLAASANSPAGRSLTFSVVSQPSAGTVSVDSTGAFNYMRASTSPGRGDVDSFVYRVTDSAGLSAQATAEVIYGRRRIMPMGDSITDGITDTPAAGDNLPAKSQRVGYRKPLFDQLVAQGYAVDFVGRESSGAAAPFSDPSHEGYPGFRQADLAGQLPGASGALMQGSPDVVLLHVGTNDVNQGSTDATPTSNLLGLIATYTQTPTNPPVRVVLATIVPMQNGAPRANDVPIFNNNLTAIYNNAWATPKPRMVVDLLDMNSRLNPATDLSPLATDVVGLHPNTTGYGTMANAWFESLVQNGAVAKCP